MPALPRRLNSQLIILVSCILVITGITSGWLNSRKQSDILLASMRENAQVMVRSLGRNSARYLVLRDYAGLEAFLLESAELPDIVRLQVSEPDGLLVGNVERGPDGKPHPGPGILRIVPPQSPAPAISVISGELVIWEPVTAGSPLGWIKASYSMSAVRQAQREAWKDSLVLSLLSVLCSIALLLLVLRPLVRRISRLTEFARHLDERKGAQMAVVRGPVEIEELGASLNYASGRLFTTEQELIRERESLRRLNRELRAISNCNQVLMRATDERTLLNDICRIICGEAGYRMAWVGYAENDDAKTVREAAWAGVEDGYLTSAVITWSDGPGGRGPTGTAIRSGESACIQDFLSYPEAAPWRESALQRGYRSSIALPLKDESAHTFGALTIYSAEPDTFTGDEIRLLEELAGDLAFGITVLRARIAHRQAERNIALMNFALDNVREAAFLIDENARFQYVNEESCRILGYARDELLGLSVADIDPDFPGERWTSHWHDLKTKQALLFEGRHRTKDGRIFPVEISANYLEYDGRSYNLALARNITERKETEEALKKSQTFVRNILESVDEGFIVVDREYRVMSVNRAFCSLINMPEDRILGRPCYQVSHRADTPCFERGEDCAVKHTFETGTSASVTHTHSSEAGEKQYVEIKSYPVTDPSGNVISVIETVNNITEKKKLEEQLRQAQKMEAIGTLAGGVAHDFNNILTAIIGYGNIIKMKMSPDDPMMESIDQILSSSDRAASLTRGLLAFSRKQILNPSPVDLNTIVRSIDKLLLRIIGEDIELSTSLAGQNLIVMADVSQIEQILMNLATNARDAMPDGGTLSITTQRSDLNGEFAALHGFGTPGRYALIAVSDTGLGMDEETRDKIFEPFFTTKELGKGTGLGLAIVYGIVKQHNGNITVYSEPGKGTTFKIYLPLIAAELEQTRAEDDALPPGGQETILLAEDDEHVRGLARIVLEDFGYHVIEAADGQEAVDKYRERSSDIDLVILDVVMPKKSGREAYDVIKSITPSAAVLFTSGYTADIIHKKGIFEADLQFISKPISPSELLRKIRDILDGKR